MEKIDGHIPNLKVEPIEPVLCRRYPEVDTFMRLEVPADTTAR